MCGSAGCGLLVKPSEVISAMRPATTHGQKIVQQPASSEMNKRLSNVSFVHVIAVVRIIHLSLAKGNRMQYALSYSKTT